MRKLIALVAIAVTVAFAGVAAASECPLLIKQLKDGVAKVADAGKKAEAEKMIAEAQKLHESGKHADSVKKADEAAKVAGITLQHKK